MIKHFVKIRFDVHCTWEAFPPQYRVFVNDELFAERTFIWDEKHYIKEMLQIEARPGIYSFRIEELEPKTGNFTVTNPVVELGRARILDNNRFEII